jgi:hypothetical protein
MGIDSRLCGSLDLLIKLVCSMPYILTLVNYPLTVDLSGSSINRCLYYALQYLHESYCSQVDQFLQIRSKPYSWLKCPKPYSWLMIFTDSLICMSLDWLIYSCSTLDWLIDLLLIDCPLCLIDRVSYGVDCGCIVVWSMVSYGPGCPWSIPGLSLGIPWHGLSKSHLITGCTSHLTDEQA